MFAAFPRLTACSRFAAAAVLFLAALLAGAAGAQAASGPWVKRDHVQARLLSSVDGTGDLATVPVGVEVKLDGDWKTYWRAPGEAGLPPGLDWSGSTNFAKAALLYPAPHRLTLLGIQTFGYKHDVLFPVDVSPAARGKPLDLKLKLDLLVCAELCIPQSFDLPLEVPAGPAAADPAAAQAIARARAAVPGNSRAAGLSLVSASEVSDGGRPALQVVARADAPFTRPDVVAEFDPPLDFAAPRVSLSSDRHEARMLLPFVRKPPVGFKLAGRHGTFTVLDGDRALEQPATVAAGTSVAAEDPGPSLLLTMGIALLGGMILNLMPCVLPVLSLKVLSVVGQGGRAPGAVRAGFLATAAGIVSSFLVIAAALVALKAAGHAVGWGLQFQEPGFIAALAVLVTVFACHLAGWGEVPLPRWIARATEGRAGPDETLAGHFATGAFAAVLATPCSAPFLGTAVGFALAGDAPVTLAIFAALGVGLAAPYLLVAAVPKVAAALPRPGRWMLLVKKLLALPLAATAVWLIAILATQVGAIGALLVAALLGAIATVLFAREHRARQARAGTAGGQSRFALPAVAALALGAVALPYLAAAAGVGAPHASDDAISWTRFDRTRIRSLVAQGRTVFVDVTADWCLTCQANKRFVLSRGALATRLNGQTVPMQADWTRPDPAIGAFLASYGRFGIPFNIVYGPGAPAGIVLPELLTAADVNAALSEAGGRKAASAKPLLVSPKLARADAAR